MIVLTGEQWGKEGASRGCGQGCCWTSQRSGRPHHREPTSPDVNRAEFRNRTVSGEQNSSQRNVYSQMYFFFSIGKKRVKNRLCYLFDLRSSPCRFLESSLRPRPDLCLEVATWLGLQRLRANVYILYLAPQNASTCCQAQAPGAECHI